MEAGGQGQVTQAYYQIVREWRMHLAYACKADIKTSSLQKLEAWLVHCLLSVGNEGKLVK